MHILKRRELGMKQNARPYTGERKAVVRMRGIAGGRKHTASKRQRELVDIAYFAYLWMCSLAGDTPSVAAQWFLEFGQSAERNPFGPTLPAVTTRPHIFYFGLRRVFQVSSFFFCLIRF